MEATPSALHFMSSLAAELKQLGSARISQWGMPCMGDFHPTCPKCNKLMNRGHMPDHAYGDARVLQAVWAPGDPEPRRFQTGIKADPDAQIHSLHIGAWHAASSSSMRGLPNVR